MSETEQRERDVDLTLPWPNLDLDARADIVDTEPRILHRIDDLVESGLLLVCLLGVLLLSIYAQRTTSAVTSDVMSVISTTLRQISLVPVRIIENFVTLLVPVITVCVLAWRRQWATMLQALVLGMGGALIAWGVRIGFAAAAASGPFAALLVQQNPDWSLPAVAISPSLAGVAALMRMAGERSRDTYLRGCWAALWIVFGLLVIQGRMTLVSALVTALIGAIVGSLGRYGFGMPSRRGSGAALMSSLTTLGVTPVKVVRVDSNKNEGGVFGITVAVRARKTKNLMPETQLVSSITASSIDCAQAVKEASEVVGIIDHLPPYAQSNRCYAVWDAEGHTYLAEVTDSDRLLLARFADWWSRLRLNGTEHSSTSTIRDSVEHTVLVWQAAHAAGVRTPAPLGVTGAESSYVALFKIESPLRPLSSLSPDEVTDEVLTDLWQQLKAAHTRGLTHRNIDGASVTLDADNRVNLIHWDRGEVAGSDLSQHVDLVQALVLTSLLTNAERSVAVAQKVLGEPALTSLLPVLQNVALPASMRSEARRAKLLPQLRTLIQDITKVEPYDLPAVELRGFSIKTLIITTVGVIALVVVFSTFNFTELSQLVAKATWWWLIVGYFFSLLNAPAQTMILKGVCPEKLKWGECTAVQLAGSLTSLVAPTGVGVAALNLRYLNKQRVPTALALATVSLMQAFQFVVTVVLLLLFVGFTGTSISVNFFSGPMLIAVISLIAIVGAFFAITPTRRWAVEKLQGPLSQVWPRVVWVMGSPRRVIFSSLGVVCMVLAQVLCFGCSLAAFGKSLSFTALAVTFLVSNTIGSLVPTPGGLGPIEASLTGGLQLAGISSAVALSTALTYRLLTFWGRAPLGWVALKYLQRKDIL